MEREASYQIRPIRSEKALSESTVHMSVVYPENRDFPFTISRRFYCGCVYLGFFFNSYIHYFPTPMVSFSRFYPRRQIFRTAYLPAANLRRALCSKRCTGENNRLLMDSEQTAPFDT